jgi:UDPglucose 6-dehydrogenase
LNQGTAVDDFMKPARVLLGVDGPEAGCVLSELYGPFIRPGTPLIFMDIRSAERMKHAAIATLAARISFMNQLD